MQIHVRNHLASPDVFGRQYVACAIEGCPWEGKVIARPGRSGDRDAARRMQELLHAHLQDAHAQEVRNRGGMLSQRDLRRWMNAHGLRTARRLGVI